MPLKTSSPLSPDGTAEQFGFGLVQCATLQKVYTVFALLKFGPLVFYMKTSIFNQYKLHSCTYLKVDPIELNGNYSE